MKTTYLTGILCAVLITFSACTDPNDVQETGKLSIRLTDAPFPTDLVAEANVTVFRVDARFKGEMDDITSEEEKDNSGFIILMEEEIPVNLLDLTNGVTANLVTTEVPVGVYDHIRLFVKGVNVVLKDGKTYDLKVPSGSQSGIKIFIKPYINVESGLTADLLLDFDVSRSFVPKAGGATLSTISGFNFKPVIKASNLSTAGSLAGIVTTLEEEIQVGIEEALITIYAADTVNTSTFTDADGFYKVMGLQEGLYDIEVSKAGFTTQSIEDIMITPANLTEQNFELTPD